MHHRIMVRRERESKSEIAGFGGFNLPFPAISNRLESEKETPAQSLKTLFTDDFLPSGSTARRPETSPSLENRGSGMDPLHLRVGLLKSLDRKFEVDRLSCR